MINTLFDLYSAFDVLYSGILPICQGCTDHDCEGYIWLMPDEEYPLFKAGAEIVEVNGECGVCNFINPLNSRNPNDFERMKPKCPLRDNGLCSVYSARPLVCRIYPVGFLNIEGETHIILSEDCAYSRSLFGENRNRFIGEVLEIFDKCSSVLYREIVEVYSVVDGYFKYPEGPNKYEALRKL